LGRRPVVFRRGLHGDGVAELLELVDEALGAVFGWSGDVVPVWAELGVIDLSQTTCQ
jgi:hypothetical protein